MTRGSGQEVKTPRSTNSGMEGIPIDAEYRTDNMIREILTVSATWILPEKGNYDVLNRDSEKDQRSEHLRV